MTNSYQIHGIRVDNKNINKCLNNNNNNALSDSFSRYYYNLYKYNLLLPI